MFRRCHAPTLNFATAPKRVETNLVRGPNETRMDLSFLANNPLVVGFVVLLLGFILYVYLFIRRTVTGFRDGVQNGRR